MWAFWMSVGIPCMHICIQLTRGKNILDSAEVNKFCTVAFHIFGFPVWNLLYITLLAPRILQILGEFLHAFVWPYAGTYNIFSLGGRGSTEAIYNLGLILKTML
jgi:hypothetical protein